VRRLPAALLAALGLALAGCAHQEAAAVRPALTPTPTPRPASLFVSPAGSDTSGCTRAAPCATFERAYSVATPGDIVDVASGDYGKQVIPALPGRTGPAVELRSAAGADVRADDLGVAGDEVVIRGMAIAGVGVTGDRTVSGVTLVDIHGKGLWINGVRDVTVRGGSFGGVADESPVRVGSSPSSHDVTFDGVLFHDARLKTAGAHVECLLALDVQGLTIRNSRFRGCAIFGVLVGHLFGKSPRDVLIERNVFEATLQRDGEAAPYSMMVGDLGGPARHFVLRDNTFMTEPALLPEQFVDSQVVGNVGAGISCRPGIEYAGNTWAAQPCGPTDTQDPAAVP
jgi:hypothetical protein